MLFFQNQFDFSNYIEKMKKNELTIEDILDNDQIIFDIKNNDNTQFIPFFSNEVIRKLIDYSTKMPIIDEYKIGHKFPFNATEILCCENKDILDRFFNQIKISIDDDYESKKNENNEDNENNKEKKNEDRKNEEKKNEDNDKIYENKKIEEKKDDNKKEEEKKDNEKKGEESKKEEISMITIIQNKIEEIEKEKKSEKKEKQSEEKNSEKAEIKFEKNSEEGKSNEKKESEIKSEEKMESEKQEIKNEDKEKEKKTIKERKYKIIYDNIDYFFQFLSSPSTNDNYVLIGYFTKIFNHLIQSKGQILISYIFKERKEFLYEFINHLNRRGIGECIKTILLFNDDIKDFDSFKISFCEIIINKLDDPQNEDKYISITETLINSLLNKDFFNLFMSNDKLLKLLFKILYNNMNNIYNSQSILSLLIKINEYILLNFDKLVTVNYIQENSMDNYYSSMFNYNMEEDKSINEKYLEMNIKSIHYLFNALKESNLNFLEDLNKFDESELLTTYGRPQKKLGIKKLLQVEYFRTIIDIIINSNSKNLFKKEIEELINIANDKKIFWTLNDIFFSYEFNNIFQIYYIQIITSVLNKFSPESLLNYFFSDSSDIENHRKLIDLLINHLINNNKLEYTLSRKSNNCHFPIEIKLLNDVLKSENDYIKNIIEADSDFNIINEIFVSQINDLFNQTFLLDQNKNDFMFMTEESQSENNNNMLNIFNLEEMINENIKIFKVYKNGGDYIKLENEKKEKIKNRQLNNNENELNLNLSEEVEENDLLNGIDYNNLNVNNNNDNFINKDEEILGNDEIIKNEKSKKEDNLIENKEYYDSNYWVPNNSSNEELDKIIKEL